MSYIEVGETTIGTRISWILEYARRVATASGTTVLIDRSPVGVGHQKRNAIRIVLLQLGLKRMERRAIRILGVGDVSVLGEWPVLLRGRPRCKSSRRSLGRVYISDVR